nr:hypothetical protein [Tanacetum cinerariifolium]
MAWTTSDTRYESVGLSWTQEISLTDNLIPDDSIPDEQVHLSDDEDSENNHLLTTNSRKGWWKPLIAEERPVTPTGDMMNFLNWYCRQVNKTKLTQEDLEGQVDWTNPEGDQVSVDVNRPLSLGGPPGHVTIQSHDSSSRRKEVISHMRILSVVKIKAYSRYGYDYLSEIFLQRDDLQEHMISKKDFKNLVKEFKIKRLNLGMNTYFWTQKDVTRSKEFIAAIERRPKTRRIYRNLECFVGGRVCDIDYRLI